MRRVLFFWLFFSTTPVFCQQDFRCQKHSLQTPVYSPVVPFVSVPAMLPISISMPDLNADFFSPPSVSLSPPISLEAIYLFDTSASLQGSDFSQRWQNIVANREGLTRFENDAQVHRAIADGTLVLIRPGLHFTVSSRLKNVQRYGLSRVPDFLNRFSSDFSEHFPHTDKKIVVSSALRTARQQWQMVHRRHPNRNAADPDPKSEKASSHMTGATIDVLKRGLSQEELNWIRVYLLDLESRGIISATEEFRQPVFHIMVFDTSFVETYIASAPH
jgi:hypothetical protein